MTKIAIRWKDHDMIGRTIIVLNPGTKKVEEIKADLNAFFLMQDLPYYAAKTEDC